MFNGDVQVPLMFQNNSLVVRGFIRTLAEPGIVRTLKATLSEHLQQIADGPVGWTQRGEVWIASHLGQHFQYPQYIPALRDQREGLCRTTLVEKDGSWELVEMTEPLDGLEDQEAAIEELREGERATVLSFVAHHTTSQSPEDLGFSMGAFEFRARGLKPGYMRRTTCRKLRMRLMRWKAWKSLWFWANLKEEEILMQ